MKYTYSIAYIVAYVIAYSIVYIIAYSIVYIFTYGIAYIIACSTAYIIAYVMSLTPAITGAELEERHQRTERANKNGRNVRKNE